MENSRRFLDAFVAIEMYLKDRDSTQHSSFSQRLNRVSKRDKKVAHFARDLEEFAQLRNAITHSRVDGDEAIAEPHDSVVAEIESILKTLEVKQTLIQLFDKPVYKADLSDNLEEVIDKKRALGYSVVPVYRDKKYYGMIHDGLYARCFEENLSGMVLSSLEQLLSYQEKRDRVVFLSHDAELLDAIEIFNEHQNKGTRLIAIVISNHAHLNEEPLLILTLADYPKIISNLNN